MGKDITRNLPIIGPIIQAKEQTKALKRAEEKAAAEQASYEATQAAETEEKRKRVKATADLSTTGAGARYGYSSTLLNPNTDLSSLFK